MYRSPMTIAGIMLALLLFQTSCRDEYFPDLRNEDDRILVVDGFLNVGGPSTTLRLMRATRITSIAANDIRMEYDAQIVVEGTDSSKQALPQLGNGYYGSALQLTPGQSYRVRIQTTDGQQYLSSFVEAKLTPAIDSIGWDRYQDGVTVHVSTHDDNSQSRYYRWEFEETWEIRSMYFPYLIYENRAVRYRQMPAEDVSVCFKYQNSTSVLIGNSGQLQTDVIHKAPLIRIPPGDEKLAERYSILVRQYVIDKGAYDFLRQMKINTEQIGSVFGPMPAEVSGNITCITDPGQLVVGYISASSVVETRKFISNQDLPGWFYAQDCAITQVDPDSILDYFEPAGKGLMPFAAQEPTPGIVEFYYASLPRCVDCTTRGGKLERPSYW